MDRTSAPVTPSRPLRRASTAPISSPAASASAVASPAGASANSEADAVETLYAHPAAKVIAFSASSSNTAWYTPRSPSPETGFSMEDEPGSLPWSSRLERTLAVGPLQIYKAPRSVAFLSCGSALQPILPKSKCWCIDEESSKFVLQIRRPQYWRIELPVSDPDEVELALAFRDVLDDILLFEKTPCPFKRTFEVAIPEMPEITYIPWAPRVREAPPEEPVEEKKSDSPPKTPQDDSAWLSGPSDGRTRYQYTMPDWESRIGEPTPPETPRGSKDSGKQAPVEANKAEPASSGQTRMAAATSTNGRHSSGKVPAASISNGPDAGPGTSPYPPISASSRSRNGRLESVLVQSGQQADSDKPVVHHRATASTISVRRPTLSTLPPAANLFSPPNLRLKQDPSRLKLARTKEIPAAIIKKTMELLIGPPTYLIKLMLKVAARIAAGQWRGLVFGFNDSGERIPVQWDYSDGDISDDDDNYYYMPPIDDADEDPSQGWGVD